MKRSLLGAGLLVCVPLVAHADDAKPKPPAPRPASSSTCALRGTHPVPKGTPIVDDAGTTLATFTGARAPLTVRELPADPRAGRARVATSAGVPSLRIEGLVDAKVFEVFTTRDLPVKPPHVAIASAMRVRPIEAKGDTIIVELDVLGTRGKALRATATCADLALEPGTPVRLDAPADGRRFSTRNHDVELFDGPNGRPLMTLPLVGGVSLVFSSPESKVGYARVTSRFDLVVDAWMPLKDLDPLRKGELVDQRVPVFATAGAQLSIDGGETKTVRLAAEVPVRAKPDDAAPAIGAVEAGADVLVVGVYRGWANLLPKDLSVAPTDDGGFWVKADQLPK